MTVEITQVNDAPVLVNVAPAAAYGIGTAGALLSPALGVFDVDATPPSPLTGLNSATISIANGFIATDQLFVNLTDDRQRPFHHPDGETTNITVQSNASGTLTLVGQDTLPHWQSILDAVSYKSTAADPTNGGANTNRTITWTVNDGELNSQTPNTDPDNFVNTTILHFAGRPVARSRRKRGRHRLHHHIQQERPVDPDRRYRRCDFRFRQLRDELGNGRPNQRQGGRQPVDRGALPAASKASSTPRWPARSRCSCSVRRPSPITRPRSARSASPIRARLRTRRTVTSPSWCRTEKSTATQPTRPSMSLAATLHRW